MVDKPNILIIDDDEELAIMLQSLFATRGYRPWVAHSAAEVAAMLTRNDIEWPMQVIMLDLMMPYVDGSELYDWLRAHPKTAETPILVLSANDTISKRVEMLQKGANDYLVKPCPAEEMLAKVKIHSQLHTLRQSAQVAHAQMARQSSYWEALAAVGQFIRGQFDLDETLGRVVEIVVQDWRMAHCTIYLYEAESGRTTAVAHAPHTAPPTDSHTPFLRRVILQQELLSSGDMVGLPLLRHRSLLGVLVLQLGDQPQTYALQQALLILGAMLSMTITNGYLFESLQMRSAVAPPPEPTPEPTMEEAAVVTSLQNIQAYIQMLLQFQMDDTRRADYLHRAEGEVAQLLAHLDHSTPTNDPTPTP